MKRRRRRYSAMLFISARVKLCPHCEDKVVSAASSYQLLVLHNIEVFAPSVPYR